MTTRALAVVLSGGGARGALQAGALRALVEARIRPDLLVGTSIGGANAACLALSGVDERGLCALDTAWRDASVAQLLPPNYLWLTLRALVGRASRVPENRMRDFFVAHGLSPEMRFADIHGVRLALVAADIGGGKAVIYGAPEQHVLEGVLASVAIPPWIQPLRIGGHIFLDGGFVSTLPIEPALVLGATDIIALDVFDPRSLAANAPGLAPFFIRFLTMMQQRETGLEMQLAAARGVSVRHIALRPSQPVPVWDFSRSEELLQTGYHIAREAIAGWQIPGEESWWARRPWLARPAQRLSHWRKAA